MRQHLDIISAKGDMLRALLESKVNCSVIGIHSKILGIATFLTSVKEILLPENEEPLIVLMRSDVSGYMFPRTVLKLSEIVNVIPFLSRFEDPYLGNSIHLLPDQKN